MCSNGWDDVTAALQLLSHLDGDALNIALLVPESQWVVPGFLINSLSNHYNSPGRLAEYKRQFQWVASLYNCNELRGIMARSTQFPNMITRSTIIYEIVSPGAAGSSIYI